MRNLDKRNKIIESTLLKDYSIDGTNLKVELIDTFNQLQRVELELLDITNKFSLTYELIENYKNKRLATASLDKANFTNDTQRKIYVNNFEGWDETYKALYYEYKDLYIPQLNSLKTQKRILIKKLMVLKTLCR